MGKEGLGVEGAELDNDAIGMGDVGKFKAKLLPIIGLIFEVISERLMEARSSEILKMSAKSVFDAKPKGVALCKVCKMRASSDRGLGLPKSERGVIKGDETFIKRLAGTTRVLERGETVDKRFSS